MIVTKRSGSNEAYDIMKVISVLHKANKALDNKVESSKIREIADTVTDRLRAQFTHISSEDIQAEIENTLIENNLTELVKVYIIGCYEKSFQRHTSDVDESILGIIGNVNTEVSLENSNKNAKLVTTQRDYIAGEISKSISSRLILDADLTKAHNDGWIHIHDLDYFVQPIHNCCLLNLEDMLQNGTMVGNVQIDQPKSLKTAATVATQIVASVASSQFGGITMSLAHLAPFVNVSRKKIFKEVEQELAYVGLEPNIEQITTITEDRVLREIKDSIQTINYQLNSYTTTAGQTPFISIGIYLGECKNDQERHDLALLASELFRQRIKGLKNKDGIYITQTFPKLVYVLEESNIKEDGEYYELTKLAAKCTAKRMVPDYISEKKMLEIKKACIFPMGCRSFVNVDHSDFLYSKFNLGVCSINIPHIALSSGGDPEKFWKILDERMELLYRAQMIRYKKLTGVTSDVAPILWQYGALARLAPGEKIDSLLKKEHSTISVGYVGLYEAVLYMTGKSIKDDSAIEFAKSILKKLNEYCTKWKKETDLGWGIYGTPAESLAFKFAKACVRDFGTVDGVNARNYITNSYHVHVTEQVDAFTKLSIESELQELSTGGAISYIETPNMQDNIPAVLSVLKYIYDNIMYAELNCKSDYCYECGFSGEMKAWVRDDKYGWQCPECGNSDQSRISVVRRTCGYLGSNYAGDVGFNRGRFDDITNRVLHL